MGIKIYKTNSAAGAVAVEISDSDWRLMEPLLRPLFLQWGDFFGPYADGQLNDHHIQQIYIAIEDEKKISDKVRMFFAPSRQHSRGYYLFGD